MLRILELAKVILVLSNMYLSSDAASLSEEFDHAAWLDENEEYKLYWTVKHADKSIYLAAEVKTTGWIGFGISQGLSGMMRNADIAIAWVDATGKAHLKDCQGIGNIRPTLDQKQDYVLTGSRQNSTTTVIKFKRKFRTCDEKDRDIIKGTTKVIYAIGNSDPTGNSFSMLEKHAKKGARSLNLLNYIKNVPVPAGTKYFDMLQHNVRVLPKDTVYWCQAYKISDLVQLNSTQHIIEVAPFIQKRAEGLVHHIVVYSCKDDFNETHLNVTGECYGNMPQSIKQCAGFSTFAAWAIGGGNFRYPDHVGFPIGASYSVKYVVMEIHFDNPLKRSDFVDTSGLRYYYTSPRKYEAGIIDTGVVVNPDMVIPPKQMAWNISGVCTKECTERLRYPGAFSGDAVKIFASFPHTHLLGTKVRTTLVRNGVEVKEIFRVDNYDFNYQQMYTLQTPVDFRAGDELYTYCQYNSMQRNYATIGGLGTQQEMCLNFLLYYPRVNLAACFTSERLVRKDFEPKFLGSASGSGDTRWNGVSWNSTMVDKLNDIYKVNRSDAVLDVCFGEKASVHIYKHKSRPFLTKALKRTKYNCTTGSSANYIKQNLSTLAVIIVCSILSIIN